MTESSTCETPKNWTLRNVTYWDVEKFLTGDPNSNKDRRGTTWCSRAKHSGAQTYM